MKIYIIDRLDEVGYDEYWGFVVCAANAIDAVALCDNTDRDAWPKHRELKVTEIGQAYTSVKEGILFESFNAG